MAFLLDRAFYLMFLNVFLCVNAGHDEVVVDSTGPFSAELLQMEGVFKSISAKQAERQKCGNVTQACMNLKADKAHKILCSTSISSFALHVEDPSASSLGSNPGKKCTRYLIFFAVSILMEVCSQEFSLIKFADICRYF